MTEATSHRPSETVRHTEILQQTLYTALHDVVGKLDAVMGIVYLAEQRSQGLGTAMIAGSPPAIFWMPDRMDLDAPYSSAVAFRTREFIVAEEPHPTSDDEYFVGLFPYAIASAPLTVNDHCYGVLSILLPTSRHGMCSNEQIEWLEGRNNQLAHALAHLSSQGIPVTSSFRPVLVPMFGGTPPESSRNAKWGLPYARGSTGLTLMYPLRRLAIALNRAFTAKDVFCAAKTYILDPFGAKDITLSAVADGRIWVVGHSGKSSAVIKRLHGSSVNDSDPTADALYGRPIFFSDSSQRKDSYPNALEDGGESWAYLPLRGGNFRRIGVCNLIFSEERTFAAEEQTVLMMMADLLGSALERVRLSQREHELSRCLQKRLLPRFLAELPEVTIAARHLSATPDFGSGGDWYDVITLHANQIGLVVGDVEGHGVESTVVMGQVRTAILAYASEGHSPSEILKRTNEILLRLDTDLLATCCVLYLNVSNGKAQGCLAGHPPPLVKNTDRTTQLVTAHPGVPLGVQSAALYQSFDIQLNSGALLLLYTDGIARRHDDVVASATELLGSLDDVDSNLEGYADRLAAAVPDQQHRLDDVALLVARYEGVSPASHLPSKRMEIQRRDLQGVRASRKFVRESLKGWGLDTLSDDLELIVSELTTNALIHADSDVELRLRLRADRIQMEVCDSETAPPIPTFYATKEEESEAEGGRGLYIVDALTSAFGSSPSGRGKIVWLEMSASREFPAE
ncbi:SpoIIE family protein phosphatase [Streptomyces sp. NBC_01717]|uniref:SpoIIE family protein phosphatase n=1 Tax=Streptomyces sp. NBC_01717 TaxID=2975918 RepID=UPI002E30541E|nr:SpoIIE family protein phosphatase [Streptomyces sp. NBC_01717]